MMVRHAELDIDVLLRRAGSGRRFCAATGADPRSVRRARTAGLTIDQADRYAIALGTHPAEVWPAWESAVRRDFDIRERARERQVQAQRRRNQQRSPRTNPLAWRSLALRLAARLAEHDLTDEDRDVLQLLEIKHG